VDPEPSPRWNRAVRRVVLAILVVAFVVGAVVLWQTGVATPANVRDWLESLGPFAPLLFLVAFVIGAFIGLPGMAFVVGGRLAFGPYLGMVLGYAGGMLAVTIPFVAARKLRRGSGWRPKHRWLARVFDQLSTHPFRAVLLLRLVLWFNPPLSYALAFSPITLRTYLAACALALVPVVATAMIATSWLV
jgi:uncharacterized membrane protein YdjX (TVP38/TMEM64 family)